EVCHGLVQVILPDVGNHHLHPGFFGKDARLAEGDARAAAGDEGDLIFQILHLVLLAVRAIRGPRLCPRILRRYAPNVHSISTNCVPHPRLSGAALSRNRRPYALRCSSESWRPESSGRGRPCAACAKRASCRCRGILCTAPRPGSCWKNTTSGG